MMLTVRQLRVLAKEVTEWRIESGKMGDCA